jgi:hypothetical protein
LNAGAGFIPARKGSSEKQCYNKSKTNLIRRVAVAFEGGDKPHPYFDMKGGLTSYANKT